MISRILVPLDGSAQAEGAMSHALAVQRSFQNAEILLLRVVEPSGSGLGGGPFQSVDSRLAQTEAKAYLERAARRIRSDEVPVATYVAFGKAAEEVLRLAREQDVSLIVLTTHGEGAAHQFRYGGTAHKVVSVAEHSVLLVRQSPSVDQTHLERIMVPLDGSPRGDWALCLAASIARANDAELLMTHVVPAPPTGTSEAARRRIVPGKAWMESNRIAGERYLRERKDRLSASHLRLRTRILVAPNVPAALNDLAVRERADLTVLAAHGESGPSGLPYGSVAQAVLDHGSTSVLVFQDVPTRADCSGIDESSSLRLRRRDRVATG